MSWLIVIILAYFLFAVVSLVDRYLLIGSPNPKIYTFYVGVLGILTLLLVPFVGFSVPGIYEIIFCLLVGAVYIFALFFLFPAIFYQRRAKLINRIFGKEVICVELQAEPWGPKLLYDLPLEEQEKTMNLEQFRKNIEFAKKTGLKEFYLWGAEWWYWLKEKQNQPEIWQEARKLFAK